MFTLIENFAGPMPWIAIIVCTLLFVTFIIDSGIKHSRRVKRERTISRLNAKARIALAGFDDETVPKNIWD